MQQIKNARIKRAVAPARGRGLKWDSATDIVALICRPRKGAWIEIAPDLWKDLDVVKSPPQGGVD